MNKTLGKIKSFSITNLNRHEAIFFAFLLGYIPSFFGYFKSTILLTVVSLVGLAMFVLAIIVRNVATRHFIIGLTVSPDKSDTTIRAEMIRFCLNSGYGVIPSDIQTVGGGTLRAAEEDWLWVVAGFSNLVKGVIARSPDGKSMLHVFLAGPAELAFMCGVTCRRTGSLRLYDYDPSDEKKPYKPAAVWNGGYGDSFIESSDGARDLIKVERIALKVGRVGSTCVSIEVSGNNPHCGLSGINDLAESLGTKKIVRIRLADGLGKKDARKPELAWPLAEQVAKEIEKIQVTSSDIHIIVSCHNASSFLIGGQVGNYQRPISIYSAFDEGKTKKYKYVGSTSSIK